MTDPATTMKAFAFYMIVVVGLGLMIVPHLLLALFGLSADDDLWIRMLGMVAFLLGIYYMLAARAGFTPLFRWSVPARLFAAGFMAAMVIAGIAGPGLLLFAAIDIGAAAWTWAALRAGPA